MSAPASVAVAGDEEDREQRRQHDAAAEPVPLRQRRRIGGEPEPGAMAEGDEAGIADEHVEAEAGDGEHDDVDGRAQRQADAIERERQHGERQRGDDERRVIPAHRHSNFWMRSPRRPRGRISRTSAMRQIHRRLAPGRVEVDGDATHDADERGGGDHAPERAEAADHHHDEGGGEDLGAHGRMHAGDRRQQHAGKPGEAEAEGRDRRHVGLQRDAERADHVGVLHAGAHHPPEGGAVDDEPGGGDGRERDGEDAEPIARIDEIAEQNLAAAAPAGSRTAAASPRRSCARTAR